MDENMDCHDGMDVGTFGLGAEAPKPSHREKDKKGVRERVCGVLSSLFCLVFLAGFCLLFGVSWIFVLSPLFLALFVIGVISYGVYSVIGAVRGV